MYMYDQQHGGGHKYRCLALANKARRLGHTVNIISNDTGANFMLQDINNAWFVNKAIADTKCDWLIVDLESQPPNYINDVKCLVCNLNGPGWFGDNGRDSDQSWADLVWVQDTPDKVIIRQTVLDTKWQNGTYNFVFGGSADPLHLLQYYDKHCMAAAYLISTPLQIKYTPLHEQHKYIVSSGDQILRYMQNAQMAITHMGITNFELAAISNGCIPQYIFSRTKGHLYYAKNLEKFGYALAYPDIELPSSPVDFMDFINTKYTTGGPPIDGKAVDRLLKELYAATNR